MGRFSNSRNIEIIAIDSNETVERPKNYKMHRLPYMSDPTIVPRVQKVTKCV